MKGFLELLDDSAAAHGHLCPGQVVGVRMAMLGCRLIGIDEPTRPDQIKRLIVYVEMDRCTADAVAHVTGLHEAVGTRLAHDITEIRPGEFKGPAFRKGHVVCHEDICRLQKLGKNQLYLIAPEEDEIHEDKAAAILAGAMAGEGVIWKDEPKEGKIELLADRGCLCAG